MSCRSSQPIIQFRCDIRIANQCFDLSLRAAFPRGVAYHLLVVHVVDVIRSFRRRYGERRPVKGLRVLWHIAYPAAILGMRNPYAAATT